MTTSTASRIRIGIVGAGGIANAHAAAIQSLPEKADLVAVVDVDSARAAAFAQKYGIAQTYGSVEELYAAGSVDLVHICTPPKTHASLAMQAVQAGIPSLVEKPTALSLEEADALQEESRRAGVPVLTVFQHRFGAGAVRLRRLAEEGSLGRPLVATCETMWHRPSEYFDMPWRGLWGAEGGGPTMGHGIHQFDLLLSVLGPWERLSAFAARQSLPTDTEDVSVAIVEFRNGAQATVVNSLLSPRESSRLRFDFEYATVEVEHVYGYAEVDWVFTPAPGREECAALWVPDEGDERSGHRHQISAVLDALIEGREPEVGIEDARRTLEFAAATYASAFRGEPVRAGGIDEADSFYTTMNGGILPWPTVKENRG